MSNLGIDLTSFKHLPIGNSTDTKKELPIDAVDKMADELVSEYSNPDYRAWYCGVIYEFGFAKIEEWRNRAREGDYPAKLFSPKV
jgi:hypothetical protein